MSTKTVFTAATTNTSSLEKLHDTNGSHIIVQITGTMDGATVTPWIRINSDVDWVALPGISYTTTGAWSLQSPTNARWQLRITAAGAGTSLTAAIASMEAQ